MSHLCQNTKDCDAHFYLDDYREATKKQFIKSMRECDQVGVMLYVGSGFAPLRIATLTWGTRHNPDLSSAVGEFEEWARNNDRLDEIGEDDPDWEYFGEYGLHIEIIPAQ